MSFIYDTRMKDLRHKYFGDIISEDRIDMPAPKKDNTEEKFIKELIKNEIKQGRTRTN